jgi:hypothetical protein
MKKNWPILVVDDEDVMCESMGAWLREDGYHVDTAPNGQKALELAKAMDYAICFVDLKMPGGMDGIETMMEIHRIRPEASIIIITAYYYCVINVELHKKGNWKVVEEGPGRRIVGAWQSTRDYAVRGERGDPRGRNWDGILGMDSPSRPARAEGEKRFRSAIRNP